MRKSVSIIAVKLILENNSEYRNTYVSQVIYKERDSYVVRDKKKRGKIEYRV